MTRISRPPIRVTVDAALRGRMVRTGLRVTLPPRVIGLRFLSWTVVGALLWLPSRSLLLAFVVALVVPLVIILIGLSQTLRRVRRAVSAGSVLTSAYDDRGRLVITRDTGDLVLERGSVRSVERVADVAVVRWRESRGPLVTPAALLTDDDVALVTSDPPVEELPYSVVVTPQVRRDLYVGLLATMGRHPVGVGVVVLLVLSSWLAVILPNGGGSSVVAFDVLVAVLFLGLIWVAQRRTFRIGEEVRAGVTSEGLRLAIPHYPALVTRPTIGRITRTSRCIVLTRRNGRRMVLPRELLQPDALRDLTGQPAQESDPH